MRWPWSKEPERDSCLLCERERLVAIPFCAPCAVRSDEPVYVVAGFQRSGTTMLMQALEAGGLSVDRAPAGDPRHLDYELGDEAYASLRVEAQDDDMELRWPRAHRGRLIKVLVGTVHRLHPQPRIVCVFIERNWAALTASYEARNGLPLRRDKAEKAIEKELSRWRAREGVELTVVDYDAVLENPEWFFGVLKTNGFPIDVEKAAAVIDTERHSVQREEVPA